MPTLGNYHTIKGRAGRVEAHRRTYAFTDVLDHYRRYFVRGETPPDGAACLLDHRKTLRKGGTWAGRDIEEFAPTIAEGVDLDVGDVEILPVALDGEGVAWRWNDDDGDYEHELYLAGEADCYLDRRIEPGKPGINVRVEIWWCGGTSGETIAAYGTWVAQTVSAIQSQGFDVALTLTATSDNVVLGERGRHEFSIVVKSFGEQLIARDFAVLFTKEGFRHLVFSSYSMPEIHEGKTAGTHLGTAISGVSYGVEFDPDTRVLHITNDSMGRHFPADDMTAMLREIRTEF